MTEPEPEPPEPHPLDKLRAKYGVTWDTDEYDHEELDPPDWITDLDREICVLLSRGLIFTPSLIAKNLDRPRSSISRRLNTLEAGGIVEKIERGHYTLTDEGHARMLETVEVDKIEENPKPDDDRNWVTFKVLTPEEVERREQTENKDEEVS
jgi:predicted transcriptional regulator